MAELLAEIESIEAQLSNRNRTDAYGNRLDDVSYQDWRGRAARALKTKLRQYRGLKAAVRRANFEADHIEREALDRARDALAHLARRRDGAPVAWKMFRDDGLLAALDNLVAALADVRAEDVPDSAWFTPAAPGGAS